MPYMKRGNRGPLVKTTSLTPISSYYRVLGETALFEMVDFGKHQDLKEAVLIAKMQSPNYLTCAVYGEDNEGNLLDEVFSIGR